jgi:hypothetical protein
MPEAPRRPSPTASRNGVNVAAPQDPQERAVADAPDAILCPRCESVCEPFQEYCVECGVRLPARRGGVDGLGPIWRRRVPWFPGDWIWPALLLLLVAAGGGALAYLTTDEQQHQTTIVATTRVTRHAAPARTGGTATASATTSATVEAPPASTGIGGAAGPPPAGAATGGLVSWPTAKSGYTTVLQSIPTTAGEDRATALARRAVAAGLASVGYLDSADFSSLHPGYYVVFSGIYNSFGAAQANAGTATSSGFASAYARRIVP